MATNDKAYMDSNSGSLTSRVTNYITRGGKPEYQTATEHPSTLGVYNQPFAKQNGASFNTFEFYKTADGTFTRDLSKVADISMDDKGKISVTIPDKWQDDEQVKSYIDNYMLETLSGNFKANKDVKYQDPYDETKQINTQDYVSKLNEGLKYRISALDATAPMKAELISRWGGTEDKNAAINNMTTDDIIIMSLNYNDDDSLVPIPAYMLEAYPTIKNLESFDNEFVKKKDFLDNFYNIEDGKITEENAENISRTPKKLMEKIEGTDHEELAKTIAFGNFIGGVDPKRSGGDVFLQGGDALSKGFFAGVYDWFIDTSDLVANIANFSLITGETIETRDFWDGLLGFWTGNEEADPTKYLEKNMESWAYTNKGALSAAQSGYVQGRIAGEAIDLVVSMVGIGEATKFLSGKLTSAIVAKGAKDVASVMAKTEKTSKAAGLATEAQSRAAFLADVETQNAAISKAATKGALFRNFFNQTITEAAEVYTKALGGTTAILQSMGPAQVANVVNSAAKVATTARVANTAVNVLGTMVLSAVVMNKELTTKVLSNKATNDEAKTWINQVMFDSAAIGALSWGTNVAARGANSFYTKWVEGSKIDTAFRQFSQKASQKTMKFTNTINHPWQTFMRWFLNNKMAAKKVSNATATSNEALKEAVLANEMRAYGATLSTEPGSYGTQLIEKYLESTGVERGVTIEETLKNLSRAGVVVDPATLRLSEYEAWQADYAGAFNAMTSWGDVSGNVSQVVHEFTNPDVWPAVSQQMSEINKANTALLNAEQEAGLLSNKEIKANKDLMKEDAGYIYAMHSPELSKYIVRKYELKVVSNEALSHGNVVLEEYQPYLDAKARLDAAAEAVPEHIRRIADTQYVPALTKAEYNIINIMVDAGVYPKSFVEAMRASGKFGEDGVDWMRLVSKKDLPKGVYSPFSKTVKEDNTISLNRFEILEDDQITWPGNGLQELINEYAVARSEKKFVEESKNGLGKTTEVVVSGEDTKAANMMKEYKEDFTKAVRQGFKSFTESVEDTLAIGRKRTAEQKEYFKRVSTTGGIETIDIDALRAVMSDNNLPMLDSVVDQTALDKFMTESTKEARRLILDVVGDKLVEPSLTEAGWEDFWKNANPNIRKILRGELEKTSLQTGYGIKDTRARLNAQMPGVDVLDWSLLGRGHTNGLVPGGLYARKESPVRAYMMSPDDLAKLTGYDLDKAFLDTEKAPIERPIESNINTKGAVPVLPVRIRSDSNGPVAFLKMRWGHNADSEYNWTEYIKGLKERGIEKIPVAVEDVRGADFNSIFYQVRNSGIAQKGLDNIVNEIDKAIATGKKPKFTVRDISAALHVPGWTWDRLRRRIRRSLPSVPDTGTPYTTDSGHEVVELPENGVSYITNSELESLLQRADDYDWSSDEGLSQVADNIENVVKNKLGRLPKDITDDVKKAFSEYGQIPFYRGQHGLGEFSMNGSSATSQVGDAYWIAPNSSYTDSYGSDKIAGNIPIKYFMSDKEKLGILRDIYRELEPIQRRAISAWKNKMEKNMPTKPIKAKGMFNEIEAANGLRRMSWDVNEADGYGGEWIDRDGYYYSLEVVKNGAPEYHNNKPSEWEVNFIPKGSYFEGDLSQQLSNGLELISKKDVEKFKKLGKIVDGYVDAGAAKSDLTAPENVVLSYRALAEYAKKPVIDISEDEFANGTAFFYYEGVDPKFDKAIKRQLETQKQASDPTYSPEIVDDLLVRLDSQLTIEDLINIASRYNPKVKSNYQELVESLEMGTRGAGQQAENLYWDEVVYQAKKETPGIATVLDRVYYPHPEYPDAVSYSESLPEGLTNILYVPKANDWILDDEEATKFLKEITGTGKFPDILEALPGSAPELLKKAWDVINPSSPTRAFAAPEFRQPNKPTYTDYRESLAENPALTEDILRAIRDEQYNKLADLKQKNSRKYELLSNKVDRANAVKNEAVRQSREIQVAAEEFRKNIKDFENTALFTDKFSYIAKAPAGREPIQDFVDENKLELPNDKRPLKNKVKHALWQKIQNGEELPKIKGIKKKDLEPIINGVKEQFDAEKYGKLLEKAKRYKTLDRFEKMNNPIKGSEIWGEKPASAFQADNRGVRVDLFPNDAVKGTGITKQYLLNLFKDAYEQGVTSVFPSYGSYTKEGTSFMDHLVEQGWLSASKSPSGHKSYSISSKIKDWEVSSPLADIYNKAHSSQSGDVIPNDIKKQLEGLKKEFYEMLDKTSLFKSSARAESLKYELDEEALYQDIDDAIEGMIELIRENPKANIAIESMITYQGYTMSPERYEFVALGEILSSEGKKEFKGTIDALSHTIVDSLIPQNQVIIKGNQTQLYNKVAKAIREKLESRFAMDRAYLESIGEKAEHSTVTELLKQYRAEIEGTEKDDTIIKTMDENGEIQYERVTPALADIYNERVSYSPVSTAWQVLNNLAVLKKINTTDLSPRSFAKQAMADPALAFATVGALPGTLQALRDEIAYQFGPAILRAMEKNNPLRYSVIQEIASREGISEEKALARNLEAMAKVQVPFTLLNRELLHQANVSKYGNKGAIDMRRKSVNEKMNAALRRVSNVLGTPQNLRESYTRLYAGEKAFRTALKKGYSLEQAETLREHAINTATTNFRQKHSVFNILRSTVPYITSGISGAKSFWRMFELDPIGVSSRIFTGFILPVIYFAGEIFSDENLRQKYEDLAESEKNNHIIVPVGNDLLLVPVGEEIGQFTNLAIHTVETLYKENTYDFWSLMLNDLVNFIPGADLTGFTDPEMLEPLSGTSPNFLEITENGVAKVLSSTMPPVFQSMYMAATGRDLYTGRPIDTSYVTIDADGNATIMSKSTSEFAQVLASVVGGDAKVIEKIISGSIGNVTLRVLDTLTSAAQFVGSGGESGSLTTGIEKFVGDLTAPYTYHGYNSLERRWNYGVASLYREKEKIERSDKYIEYNREISKENDPKRRQTLINERNNLFNEYQKRVASLVKGYRDAGGSLDKWKFSKAVSLLTFEDAVRADRQFMELNTNYSDAYKQAMQTLYNFGITNPEGPSSLGYVYTDSSGKNQLKVWTPAQIQILQNAFSSQDKIHAARIKAIIDDRTDNSLKKQRDIESKAEQPYWDKYNATGKLSNAEWDAIDDLRKAYNAKVVLGLKEYVDTYGAANVLSNDAVIDYLEDIIKVPSEYEKVKGKYVSSGGGKLNKQSGFAESYIKEIFGVK